MNLSSESLTPARILAAKTTEESLRVRIADRLLVKAVLALISAGLLTCSLPTPDIGWVAWIALVPLFVGCHQTTPIRAAALGFLSGTAANIGIYHWLFAVNGFGVHHFLILSTYFALYPAVWCAGISWLRRRGSSLLFTAPALWVALDYVRAHAGFMAFPWGTLAQTQHQNLAVLQVASLTGEYGVTFLVVMANTAIAEMIFKIPSFILPRAGAGEERGGGSRQPVFLAALIIALAHAWGGYLLYVEQPGPTMRVAAIQPNIGLHERDTAAGRAATLNRLDRLTRVAAASHPALIAWPETAVTGTLRVNPFFTTGLLELANEIQTPIVLGVGEVEKFSTRGSRGKILRRAYNSAYLLKPGEAVGAPYVKRVLLPFGEYVPLESVIGWPAWLAPPVFDTAVGEKPQFFSLRSGVIFSPLICWENLFSDLARESVRGGARMLVLLANDGWFGRTAEPYQHNLASVLRAVENRVPIVISSNTGPAQIIDPYGRTVARGVHIFSEDAVIGDVKLVSAGTLYTRIGDAFIFLIVAAFCMPWALARDSLLRLSFPLVVANILRRCFMKRLLLSVSCIAFGLVSSHGAWGSGELRGIGLSYLTTCRVNSVTGQFLATESHYNIGGVCYVYENYSDSSRGESSFDKQAEIGEIPWTAYGTYNPASKNTYERIALLQMRSGRPDNPPQPTEVAAVTTTMVCGQDPWKDPDGLPCGSVRSQTSGDPSQLLPDSRIAQPLYPDSRGVPWTSLISANQRASLKKQYADAVAAAQRKGNIVRNETAQQSIAALAAIPSILSPNAGQSFYSQTPVPIRLSSPQGWSATTYMVAIQRKNASGNWIVQTNIPISAAEAQSAQGYMGFGAGGTGPTKSPAYMTGPGTWGIAAQISAPKQSAWSDIVQFIVTAPKFTPAPSATRKLIK